MGMTKVILTNCNANKNILMTGLQEEVELQKTIL
jgi:hypothetical protein